MLKFVFALIGLLLIGPVGALIGLFIGSSMDRFQAYGAGGINPLTNKNRQAVFLKTVFILMGKLAKADGRVSEEEVAHAETVIAQLGMIGAHREEAIALFKSGASDEHDIDEVVDEFLKACGHTKNLKQILLAYLITTALADNVLDPAESKILEHIASQLGFSKAAFDQMLNMIENQSHFAGGQVHSASALKDAYAALGVKEDDSDPVIKKSYRKLMSENHPDKLIGQGLPQDMINLATERTKEIQTAYDLIKKARVKN